MLLILLLCPLGLAAQVPAAQVEATLERHAAAAAAAMQSGNYTQAEQQYRAIVRLRPEMPEAYANLGLSCFLQRDYPAAIRAFNAALKRKSDLANAKLFLGISHFKLNQASLALSSLQQYVVERPGDGQGQYYLGLTYLALERYEDAESTLLAARAIDPRDPRNIDVLYHLTQCYLGQAARDPAKRESLASRYHDAVEEIAAIDPASYRLGQLRAGFYEAEGKKDNAIGELETLLLNNPRSRGLHYTLGCLYTEAREYPKALAQFEDELKLDSPYPRTYLQLGHVYLALQQPAMALPLLKKAVDIEPAGSGLAWVDIGRAYRLQNRPDQAMEAFEKAIALGQGKASVYYQLGLEAKKAGNLQRSREALEMSQKLRREEQGSKSASTQ